MAKHRKVLRARTSSHQSRDESLLLRSAESLGRVIGALQRQLDVATRRLSNVPDRSRDRMVASRSKKATTTRAKAKTGAKKGTRKPRR